MDWIVINNWILKYEIYLRIVCAGFVLAGLGYWEYRASWRKSLSNLSTRWLTHLALGGLSAFLVRFLFPLLTLSTAAVAEHQHLGLLHSMIQMPFWLVIILSIVAMDFAMYMEHRWMHRYSILWRIHRVHHSDTEVDVTTGLRFHPLEYLFMMGVKLLAILFFGVPVVAVFIFEVMLSTFTLFDHSNIQLPLGVESTLRKVFITPNMHRIHHSDIGFEHNKNFGFCFSFWDKLFNSYEATAHQGENNLVFGLEIYRQPTYQTLFKLLALPFLKHKLVKNKFAHIR